ncbi:hypothetical protein SLEP1_g58244 [Rubroshorea leprosula]|uniref:Protein kinase domain-containing protein n=1 Tax=Rubroshorea leprosula TaxID=152421 RepID=A0AAV5MRH7_9ROSI|nr:hypothetical protein SLEP1_g58244 [Rubroshorea leprosula]
MIPDSMSLQIFFKFLKKISVESRVRERRPPSTLHEELFRRQFRRLPSALEEELCRQFSLAELRAATNNFANDSIIGTGGHSLGSGYKGIIDGGTLVAVKRCSRCSISSLDGIEYFRTEMKLICQLRHQNLVSLLGFCYENGERMLVYEYMTNRALCDHLHAGADPLPWKRRLEICIGASRGLHYLHTGAKYLIIHHDIRSSNIRLDNKWTAKLADFGFSKIGSPSMSKPKPKVLTKMESLPSRNNGYMAPEYQMRGELTEKCDVFSLGVVLFEVLCGRLVKEFVNSKENVVFWISKCIKAGSIHDIIDPYLKGKLAPACLIEFVEIALSCVHPKASERPSIGEVEVKLELALELQEKADLVMKVVNPQGGYTYEEVPFRLSVSDYYEIWNNEYLSSPDNVSNGDCVSA